MSLSALYNRLAGQGTACLEAAGTIVWFQSTHTRRRTVVHTQPDHIMPLVKPCLKAQLRCESDPLPFASCPKLLFSPHVHFPPTPTLTSTHPAYSPRTYDRAPIAISPNPCALPERGERMYSPTSESSHATQVKGSYFHPNAYEACEPELSSSHITVLPPPPLIPDLSYESDESDEAVVTPPDSKAMIPPISVHWAKHFPIPHSHTPERLETALSFLPHPPSLVRDKDKGKTVRSLSRPRSGTSRRDVESRDVFTEAALDGCLGGF